MYSNFILIFGCYIKTMKNIKDLLKNNLIVWAAVIVIILFAGAGTVFAADSIKKSNILGAAAAQRFAYLDAEVSEKTVTFADSRLTRKGLGYVYDIEFASGKTEYAYTIDAATGTIIEKKSKVSERSDDTGSGEVSGDSDGSTTPATNMSSYISVDNAKIRAASSAGLEVDKVTFTKAKLEKEDGQTVYEIEFYFDDTEYEYEVDAHSGDIVSGEKETDDDGKDDRDDDHDEGDDEDHDDRDD